MPTPPATDLAPPLGGPGAGIPAGGGTGLGSGGGLSALVSEIIDALGGLFVLDCIASGAIRRPTASPTFTVRTSLPTASTIPAASWPGTAGSGWG